MNINDKIADETVSRAIVLNRYSAGAGREIAKLLRDVERDILARLPSIGGDITRRRLQQQLKEVREIIGTRYKSIESYSISQLEEIAKIESQWQTSVINRLVGVEIMRAMPTDKALEAIVSRSLILGNTASEWWSGQSLNLQNEFSRVVKLGLAQSETNQQIAMRVRQATGVAQRHAFALTKTATQAISAQAREESLKANDDVVKGKISNATLDGHTTLICAEADQAKYDFDNKPIMGTKVRYKAIPRHFGCRSMWSALLKSYTEMGLDFEEFGPSTRASVDGQVPASVTFSKFLESKPKAWQDKYLGKGKAELYRSGKITLGDMVDGIGRELTLEELRKFD